MAAAARTTHKPHRYAMFHAYFLLAFAVLFPKGGIKLAGTPLTWGYLFIAASAPLLAIVRLLATPLRMRGTTLAVLSMLLPMQIVLAYAFLTNGYINLGYSFSMVAGIALLPAIFLVIYPPFFFNIYADRLSRFFRFCMLLAALWGIFLFFYHPFAGHYIEIPYLTVNAADYGLLETTKYNARGFFLKLISTYNNGNLYGVATLILLPMYNALEPSRWKRWTLLTATLLTLSRTVWAGIVFQQTAPLLPLLLKQFETFPVLYLGKATRQVVSVGFVVGLVFIALLFATDTGIAFLLDPSLGGRAGQLPQLSTITLLPVGPLIGFDESLYASAARFYGWAGLVSFSLIMVSPVLVLLWDLSALRSPVRMAAFTGLMTYSFVGASDGAFVLIPVTAFYWFAYTVFLHGWPGTQRHGMQTYPLHRESRLKPGMLLEPT